jgi:hypothetical protein
MVYRSKIDRSGARRTRRGLERDLQNDVAVDVPVVGELYRDSIVDPSSGGGLIPLTVSRAQRSSRMARVRIGEPRASSAIIDQLLRPFSRLLCDDQERGRADP